MFTFFRHHRSGFSLLELLVVITIIGILSGIVFVNLQRAREHGNNAQIAADIAQIQLALGTLRARGGTYPSTGGIGNFACLGANDCMWEGHHVGENTAVTTGLRGVMHTIPHSPYLQSGFRGYQYASTGTQFMLRWFYFGENRPCDPRGTGIGGSGFGITLCQYTR